MRPLRRTWLASAASGAMLLTSGVVVFVRHHGYALLTPEVVATVAIVAGAGAVAGLLMEVAGPWSRVPVLSALITLAADVQLEASEEGAVAWGVLGAVFGGALAATWLLRNHLASVGTAVFATLFASSLVLPVGGAQAAWSPPRPPAAGDPSLPVFLHLVLDEQIGVEGIPEEFDPDGRRAAALRDVYLDHGFQVFGRAYSRYYDTDTSLSNAFNFDASDVPRKYADRAGAGFALTRNAYFDLMSRRGYAIHAWQCDYVEFCDASDAANVVDCTTYRLETIKAIEDAPLATREKVRVILGMYARLSSLLEPLGGGIGRVGAVATIPVIEELHERLLSAERGTLLFVHLLLPHYPFAYRADCTLRPSTADWLNAHSPRTHPRRNNAASRAERYPPYLEQVECLHHKLRALFDELDRAGKLDEMIVVVHGDHGSRIDLGPPNMRFAGDVGPRDFVDGFSTLFACRTPRSQPAYDRRLLPLDGLFTRFIRTFRVPDGTEWAGPAQVFLRTPYGSTRRFGRRPMPDFGRELPAPPER